MADVRLIDATALQNTISEWRKKEMENDNSITGPAIIDAFGDVLDAISVAPTIDPEAEPCLNWHPASEIPLLHHEVDENKCEGTLECDVSEQLLLYTEEEGYKVGVYMKDCYGFDGWLNPDYGGTIRHVVEWQYPQKPSRERSA